MGLYNKIINMFYPSRCPFCNKVILHNHPYCCECKNNIKIDPIANNFIVDNSKVKCVSVFKYKGKVSESIKKYKFRNNKMYSKQFAIIVSDVIKKEYKNDKFDVFTYVPISFKRYMDRGFNQSSLIMKESSKLLNIPFKKLLYKNKDNIQQHKLSRKDRANNVKGVYTAVNLDFIKGKKILIFDDIMTTGSTLKECCHVLLSNGAKEVCCITLAIVM